MSSRGASSLFTVAASLAMCACTDPGDEISTENCGAVVSCSSTTADSPVSSSTASLAPSTTTPTTSPSTTTLAVTTTQTAALVRPSVDRHKCEPLAAREQPMNTYDLSLFARPTAQPFSIQAIGDPVDGPAGPFALLLRYADRVEPLNWDTMVINDWNVAVAVFPNGNGDAHWELPGGGSGYLRSRGLDQDQLIGIVSALTAREPGAAIAGFEYSPAATTHLELVAEQMNTGVRGSITSFECQVLDTGFIYRISLLGGDPIFQYGGVIDRLVPLQVGYRQGELITIQGREDPTAPRIEDIVNADPNAWNEWLTKPFV